MMFEGIPTYPDAGRFLAERGLEINLDAAVREDLHGGGREGVGDENFGY